LPPLIAILCAKITKTIERAPNAEARRDSNALEKWHQAFPAAGRAALFLDLRGSKLQ
jgi:hypothetical protein